MQAFFSAECADGAGNGVTAQRAGSNDDIPFREFRHFFRHDFNIVTGGKPLRDGTGKTLSVYSKSTAGRHTVQVRTLQKEGVHRPHLRFKQPDGIRELVGP